MPTEDLIADGSAEWLEKDASVLLDILRFVRERAERDADLASGPLLGMLLLTDISVGRDGLMRYLAAVRDDDTDAAQALFARLETTGMMLTRRKAERDALWDGIRRLARENSGL